MALYNAARDSWSDIKLFKLCKHIGWKWQDSMIVGNLSFLACLVSEAMELSLLVFLEL